MGYFGQAGMDVDTILKAIGPTLNMAAMTRKLKEQGREVIILSMGEPDFDTEEFIKEAGIAAIRRNSGQRACLFQLVLSLKSRASPRELCA